MSIDPDEIPEGLLTIPLDQLTDSDMEALRELKTLAEKHDWDGVMALLVRHSNPNTRNQRSTSHE